MLQGKEEVECDGWVCDADSSMLVTLAGGARGALQNINASPAQMRRIRKDSTCSSTLFDKI